MKVELDQSGKVEQLNTLTVIAIANGCSKAIYVTAGDKRKLISLLRKSLIPQRDIIPILFAVLVFILIKNLQDGSLVAIDEEYTGKDQLIKETINKLFEANTRRKKIRLSFAQVGKQSSAHKVAWAAHKSKSKGAIKVGFDEITKYLFQ